MIYGGWTGYDEKTEGDDKWGQIWKYHPFPEITNLALDHRVYCIKAVGTSNFFACT